MFGFGSSDRGAMPVGGMIFLDSLIMGSDLCTCGTFVTIFIKLRTSKSAAGLSLLTLFTIVAARTLHLFSHVIGLHYSPAQLPKAIYPTIDIVNAAFGVFLLSSFVAFYAKSYEREKDNFGIHLFKKFGWLPKQGRLSEGPVVATCFLYASIAVMALGWYFVRRSPHNFLVSYFCCFYEVTGAVALVPQLWMFHQDKRVSPLLANFVVFTALNRLLTLSFWVCYPWVYIYRYPDNRGIQMASETLNILILSDFLFYWVRSKLRGDVVVIIGDGLDV